MQHYLSSLKRPLQQLQEDLYLLNNELVINYVDIDQDHSSQRDTDLEQSKKLLNITNEYEEQGKHVFHILSTEWENPQLQNIWKSMIEYKLGQCKRIFARQCTKQVLTPKEAKTFCLDNHIQGFKGGSIYEGLYYGSELVMVVIFGKSRYNKDIDLELIRLCTKKGLCVVGGASKLLKPYSFLSYGNRRWCNKNNNVYHHLADLIYLSDPCYYYNNNGKLYHRSSYMKHKLKDKLEYFNPDDTEVNNCYANGLTRIWDVGCVVYVKHFDNDVSFIPRKVTRQ